MAIHFTWKPDWPAVAPAARDRGGAGAVQARPHWGKLFVMGQPALAALYDRLPDFKRRIAEDDPRGKFGNAFLTAHIHPA